MVLHFFIVGGEFPFIRKYDREIETLNVSEYTDLKIAENPMTS